MRARAPRGGAIDKHAKTRTGQNNKEQQGTTRRNQKQPEATKNTTVRGAEPCWQCFSIHQQTKRQETTLASSSYIELQSNSIELQSKSYPSPIELYKCKECPRARTRASAPARFERMQTEQRINNYNKNFGKTPGMICFVLKGEKSIPKRRCLFAFSFFISFFALPSHTRAPACARARERARTFRENKKRAAYEKFEIRVLIRSL